VRRSAFISLALHAAILLWILVVFPGGRALDAPKIEDVPVDILTPSEFTKIKAGMADAKDDAPAPKADASNPTPMNEKEQPKLRDQVAAVPPPPAEEKTDEPKAEAKPKESKAAPEPKLEKTDAPKEPAPKKEEPKKAEAKPAKPAKPVKDDTPKRKKLAMPVEKKHDFNTDRIAALLNKIPDAGGAPQTQDAPDGTPKKPVHGQSSGTQLIMSANEMDALRARIAQCWSPPPGGLGADQIVVKMRLQLNEDGTLVGYPTVANSSSSPFFQAAADSAVRAVYQCQPYSLPAKKYSVWRDMILNFDPRQMYGSASAD
jgi:hypothetical protein